MSSEDQHYDLYPVIFSLTTSPSASNTASHLFVFSIFLLPSREYPFFFLSTYVPAEHIQSGI